MGDDNIVDPDFPDPPLNEPFYFYPGGTENSNNGLNPDTCGVGNDCVGILGIYTAKMTESEEGFWVIELVVA